MCKFHLYELIAMHMCLLMDEQGAVLRNMGRSLAHLGESPVVLEPLQIKVSSIKVVMIFLLKELED